jgi:uncharacterized protein (TIRG00374 family)
MDTRRRLRTIAFAVAMLGLAALLLWWLTVSAGIAADDVWRAARRPPLAALALIVLCSLLHLVCSGLKWLLVLRRVAPEETARFGLAFASFYSGLGAMLGNVVTTHVSGLLVRSIAARLHHRVPALRGATSSVYEQAFDAGVQLLAGLLSLFALLGHWSPAAFVAGLLGVFVAAIPAMLWLARRLVSYGARLSGDGAAPKGLGARARRFVATCVALGLLTPRMLLSLYLLSVLRLCLLILRSLLIALFAGYAFVASDVAMGFPLIQVMQIFAPTPGGFGVVEWSWSGLLVFHGFSLERAAAFAYVHRILSIVAVTSAFVVIAAHYLIGIAWQNFRVPAPARVGPAENRRALK